MTNSFPEKLNIKFVDPGSYTGLPSSEERLEMEQTQKDNRRFLNIPRRSIIVFFTASPCMHDRLYIILFSRPSWDSSTTADQLEQLERDSFLEWRRQLATLQENEKLLVTPFERNLEFWRQLWRVIERRQVMD